MATTDRDKARDLLRGWQAAHQVQNRDGSSAVSASGPLTLARQAWRSRRAVATMGDGVGDLMAREPQQVSEGNVT